MTRLNWREVAPDGARALGAVHQYVTQRTNLPRELVELVFLRVSQINGCAHCIDMHSKELRAAGASEQRLYLLNAWRESPFYSQRERAALEWAEALTLLRDQNVPDEVYDAVRSEFNETDLVNLTLALVAINGANRLNIAFRTVPGSYRPQTRLSAGASGTALPGR